MGGQVRPTPCADCGRLGRYRYNATRCCKACVTARRRVASDVFFWSHVDQSGGPESCWQWHGHIQDGYGHDRTGTAHRRSYTLLVGPIPAGLQLDHLCRNRGCVNPAHLEPVTNTENSRRGLHGVLRVPKPTCKHGHPFTEENTRWDLSNIGRRYRACRACGRAMYQKQVAKRRLAAA